MQRIFLPWTTAFLPQVAAWLCDQVHNSERIDLTKYKLVLPGGNAARRLEELLAREACKRGKALFPPSFGTVGQLPEQIIPLSGPVASRSERLLMWSKALGLVGAESLQALVPHPPEKGDLLSWLTLAERIEAVHLEISGAGLSFEGVVEKAATLSDFHDEMRWQVLAQVQAEYLLLLSQLNLVDPYEWRLQVLRENLSVSSEFHLVLVACSDLNRTARMLIERLSSPATALVFAPEQCNARFDNIGSLEIEPWCSAEIPLKRNQISIAASVSDEALSLVARIDECAEKYSQTEITIGLADEANLKIVEETLERHALPSRSAGGESFAQNPLVLLIDSLGRWSASRKVTALGALIRHPEIERYLAPHVAEDLRGLSPAECLDRYQERHLQLHFQGVAPGDGPLVQGVRKIISTIDLLCTPLSGRSANLAEWCQCLSDVLTQLFTGRVFSLNQPLDVKLNEGFLALNEVLAELLHVNQHIIPEMTSSAALGFIVRRLSEGLVPPEYKPDSIEILGWLELQLDDAPCLHLLGMNDGAVPASLNSDVLLPDTLRRVLGLTDNQKRFARDAYALTSMVHSKELLTVSFPQSGVEGDQLFPSRLLFACGAQELAARAAFLYGDAPRWSSGLRRESGVLASRDGAATPPSLERSIETLSVTDFASYVRCPYRFYLSRILRLRKERDTMLELEPLGAGLLVHEVINLFSQTPQSQSTERKIIEPIVLGILQRLVEQRYAENALPAVMFQIDQIQNQLKDYARWQAVRNQEGWEIKYTEKEIDPQVVKLHWEGGSIGIRGRIDRVEYNSRLDSYAVIDFKTGGSHSQVNKAHRLNDEWIDFQLPLYDYAFRVMEQAESIQLGYVVLSPKEERVHESWATWDDSALAEACERAGEVAQKICAGVFWPPRMIKGPDEFKAIVGSFEVEEDDESEEEFE